MIVDIEKGIAGTDVRAGIIGEIGLSAEPHPDERKVLAAAAYASQETNVTISLHIEPGSPTGHESAAWLLEQSIPASRIIVGHVDGFIDDQYLAALLGLGVTIEFEGFHLDGWRASRFGFESATDAQRIETLARLVAEGFTPQIRSSPGPVHETDVSTIWRGWLRLRARRSRAPPTGCRGIR